jgi:hypothetical protein
MAVVGVMVTVTGRKIVTVAEAAVFPSAFAVAVTLTCAGLGNLVGAVYKPVDETVPHAAPEQPVPVTVQLTPVVKLPVTVAVNCFCAPTSTWAEVGEMLIPSCWEIVTMAVLDFMESATDLAVTVTNDGFGTVEGAV